MARDSMDDMDRDLQRLFTPEQGWKAGTVNTILENPNHRNFRTSDARAAEETTAESPCLLGVVRPSTQPAAEQRQASSKSRENTPFKSANGAMVNSLFGSMNTNVLNSVVLVADHTAAARCATAPVADMTHTAQDLCLPTTRVGNGISGRGFWRASGGPIRQFSPALAANTLPRRQDSVRTPSRQPATLPKAVDRLSGISVPWKKEEGSSVGDGVKVKAMVDASGVETAATEGVHAESAEPEKVGWSSSTTQRSVSPITSVTGTSEAPSSLQPSDSLPKISLLPESRASPALSSTKSETGSEWNRHIGEGATHGGVRFKVPEEPYDVPPSFGSGDPLSSYSGSEDADGDTLAQTHATYPTEPNSSESELSSSEGESDGSGASNEESGSEVSGSSTEEDEEEEDEELFDYDLVEADPAREFVAVVTPSDDSTSESGSERGSQEAGHSAPNRVIMYSPKVKPGKDVGLKQHNSKTDLASIAAADFEPNLSGGNTGSVMEHQHLGHRSQTLMRPQTASAPPSVNRSIAILKPLPMHSELVRRSVDTLLDGFETSEMGYLNQLAATRAEHEIKIRTRMAPKMRSSSKSAKVVGTEAEEDSPEKKKNGASALNLRLPKPKTGLAPPPGWREAATSLQHYIAHTDSGNARGESATSQVVVENVGALGRIVGAEDMTPATPDDLQEFPDESAAIATERWQNPAAARGESPSPGDMKTWSDEDQEESSRQSSPGFTKSSKKALKRSDRVRLAPVGPRVEGARSEGGSSQEAIAPRPITNSNFVPSRSKTFDAQRSGNFYGYRRMPEMHSSMTLAQLQDIVHLYYCQASEDFRAMNLVDTSKKPSHALLEARRHMTRGSNKFHDGNSSAMTAFNARFGTKNQTKSAEMQKASTPQEMLLQFVLDGRVSEEVFTSTLQREGRDIQDATVKLVCNFTARCAPQNRCQVAAMCAVADMTAFANSLATSKLEIAEAMLAHPPQSHDEATLLACGLATEWGNKQIGQMQPDVETVLMSVYNCLSKVDARLAEQLEKLHKMRVRRQNAASLSQAAQRLMLATVKGMNDLEKRSSAILQEVLGCSQVLLVGYSPEAREVIIRGSKEALVASAMTECILQCEAAYFTSYDDERLTEYDIRRLEEFVPSIRLRSMLMVPIRYWQAGNRVSCAGLLVALNKKVKVAGGFLEEFDEKDAEELWSAGEVMAPSVVAAVLHTQSRIAHENALSRAERARKLLGFSRAVYRRLEPDDIWQTIRREGAPMLGCQFMLMYVYVERGILAVHNPETGVLEFLTMGEAALAGQMFQEDQPKFVGTRRQAERLYDPSLMQIRVALDLDPSVEAEDTRGHELFEDNAKSTAEESELQPSENEPSQEEDDTLNDFIMPSFEGKVNNMLLLPLKQMLSRAEARALRGEPIKQSDGDDSDSDYDSDYDYDVDEDFLEDSEERLKAREVETTWAVLVAVNKKLTPQQEKEISLQKRVQTLRAQRSAESAVSGRYLEMPRVEFTPSDERIMERLGKILYPAIVHSHLRISLQEHLHSIT